MHHPRVSRGVADQGRQQDRLTIGPRDTYKDLMGCMMHGSACANDPFWPVACHPLPTHGACPRAVWAPLIAALDHPCQGIFILLNPTNTNMARAMGNNRL